MADEPIALETRKYTLMRMRLSWVGLIGATAIFLIVVALADETDSIWVWAMVAVAWGFFIRALRCATVTVSERDFCYRGLLGSFRVAWASVVRFEVETYSAGGGVQAERVAVVVNTNGRESVRHMTQLSTGTVFGKDDASRLSAWLNRVADIRRTKPPAVQRKPDESV